MKLELDEGQRLVRDSVRDWLQANYSFAQRAAGVHRDGGHPSVWASFAELGWLDPAHAGSLLDTGLIAQAMGRHLVVEPWLDVMLAARLLVRLGTAEQRAHWLGGIAEGSRRLLFAHSEPGDSLPWNPRTSMAHLEGDGSWTLSGRKLNVAGGGAADAFLVTAQHGRATHFYLVPVDAEGLRIERWRRIDGACGATLYLESVRLPRDAMVGTGAESELVCTLLEAESLRAWQAVGTMQAAMEMTLSHVRSRRQFGEPLIALQSVRQRLAEIRVQCTEAEACCELTAMQLADPQLQQRVVAPHTLASLRVLVSKAARFVSKQCVQLSGGMGVSDELPIASCFRTLLGYLQQGGDADLLALYLGDWALETGSHQRMRCRPDTDGGEFRREVRRFVAAHLTEDMRRGQAKATSLYPEPQYSRPWHRALRARGWLVPLWPKEWGGTGWSAQKRFIFESECALAGAPLVHPMGTRLVGPLLIAFGSEEQKRFYLPRILDDEDYWCQGFSESEAGSDLVSLRTRAVREGDEYVVTGTKLWTTQAHFANRMFALVRTGGDGPPRKGLSFLLIDMKAPGVTVRPIITIDGLHEVNEVHLDGVRVPVSDRIGEEGQGWALAKFLLEFERGAGIFSARLRVVLNKAASSLRARMRSVALEAPLRRRFGQLLAELDSFEWLELRSLSQVEPGRSPGKVAPMLKLRASRLRQDIAELAVRVLGEAALRWHEPGTEMDPLSPLAEHLVPEYCYSRAYTIFGGAAEIQLELIARDM